jgi:hypothetical protein
LVDLDGGDARVLNAVYHSRRVFVVLTSDISNTGLRSGWLTLKLDVDSNGLDWHHLLASNEGTYFIYPAITTEGAVGGANGNVAVFGSWTDAETLSTPGTNFASSIFKIYTDHPSNTDGPFVNYQSGAATYENRDSNDRNRWGDYSGAGFDWSTGNVWGATEYAGASNTWRTRITGRSIAETNCVADLFELDDTPGESNGIFSDGTPQTHNICPVADHDWVFFTLAKESNVVIETAGPSGDTEMWLREVVGLNEIEYDDDDGASLFSKIDRTCGVDALTPGSYYVEIGEFSDDGEIGTYNLAVTATDCPCVADAFEPDDTSGQASAIASGVTQGHNICPVGDEDWATVTLAESSQVVLETSGPAGDTRMWLRDAGLNEIEFDDDDGAVVFSLIDRVCGVDPLPAGTYFVEVDEFGDNAEIESYNLDLSVVPCGCPADLVLADQTLSGTQTLEATTTATLGPNLIVDGDDIVVNAPTVSIFGPTDIGGTFSIGTTPACP